MLQTVLMLCTGNACRAPKGLAAIAGEAFDLPVTRYEDARATCPNFEPPREEPAFTVSRYPRRTAGNLHPGARRDAGQAGAARGEAAQSALISASILAQ